MSRGFKSQLEKKLSQASSLKTQSLQQASFIVAIFYTCNRVLELAPCRQSFHFQQLDFFGKILCHGVKPINSFQRPTLFNQELLKVLK